MPNEAGKNQIDSIKAAFLDAANIDPSNEGEVIDMFENPELLVKATGWKKIKVPEKDQVSYVYFKLGNTENSPVSFNKKFKKNILSLIEQGKALKNKKAVVEFLDYENWDDLVENKENCLDFNINVSEISFDKNDKVKSCFDASYDLNVEETYIHEIEHFYDKIFFSKERKPFVELTATEKNYDKIIDKRAESDFCGKVTYLPETNSYLKYAYYKNNGSYHREDGPAVEFTDGTQKFFLENQEYESLAALKKALPKYKKTEEKVLAARKRLKDFKEKKPLDTKKSQPVEVKVKVSNLEYYNSFEEIPDGFTGICNIQGVECHFKNGELHREDGPAINSINPLNYAYNGVRLTKNEFENYKSFEKYRKVITEEFIKTNYKDTKEVIEKVSTLGGQGEVLHLDVKNEKYTFKPRKYNFKTKEFSKEKVLHAISKYNKEGLPSSRLGPAIEHSINGNIYAVDGIFFSSKEAWETFVKKEREIILEEYEDEFSYEKVLEKIKGLKTFPHAMEVLESGGTGIAHTDLNNVQTVTFIENGKTVLNLIYIGKKLQSVSKFENDMASCKKGPYYYDFTTRSRLYAVDGGLGQSVDSYCYEYGSHVEHANDYFSKVLEKFKTPSSGTTAVAAKVLTVAKNDAKEVAKRMATEKISQVSQQLLFDALKTSNSKNIEKLKEFIASSKGKIIVKFASGVVIDLLKTKFDEKYQNLLSEIASEFRIQSETDLTLEVIDLVQDVVKNIDLLSKLSNLEDRVRIQLEGEDNSKKELSSAFEEVIDLKTEKVPQFIN